MIELRLVNLLDIFIWWPISYIAFIRGLLDTRALIWGPVLFSIYFHLRWDYLCRLKYNHLWLRVSICAIFCCLFTAFRLASGPTWRWAFSFVAITSCIFLGILRLAGRSLVIIDVWLHAFVLIFRNIKTT